MEVISSQKSEAPHRINTTATYHPAQFDFRQVADIYRGGVDLSR
jgi:hypothetical protein